MITAIIPAHEILYSNLQALINSNEYVVTTSPSWTMIIVTPRHGSAITAKEMYQQLVRYSEQGNVIIVEPSFYEFASNCEALYGTTLEQQVAAMNELTTNNEDLGLYKSLEPMLTDMSSGMPRNPIKYNGVFKEAFYNGPMKIREEFSQTTRDSNFAWIMNCHESELAFLQDYYNATPYALSHCFTKQELQKALTDHRIK